jgi:hypothetical protein
MKAAVPSIAGTAKTNPTVARLGRGDAARTQRKTAIAPKAAAGGTKTIPIEKKSPTAKNMRIRLAAPETSAPFGFTIHPSAGDGRRSFASVARVSKRLHVGQCDAPRRAAVVVLENRQSSKLWPNLAANESGDAIRANTFPGCCAAQQSRIRSSTTAGFRDADPTHRLMLTLKIRMRRQSHAPRALYFVSVTALAAGYVHCDEIAWVHAAQGSDLQPSAECVPTPKDAVTHR